MTMSPRCSVGAKHRGEEGGSVHRSVDHEGGNDPIMTQTRHQGRDRGSTFDAALHRLHTVSCALKVGDAVLARLGSRAFLARSLVSREEASLSLDSLLLRSGQMHLALGSEHVTVKISYPLSPTGSHVEVSNGCLYARSDTAPVKLGI
jgi:hypothetical protein